MHGSLARESLPTVLRELKREGQSGILAVSRDEAWKKIYFGNGAMLYARSNVASDRLGEFLVREGRLSRSQLADASNKKRRTGLKLGTTLVAMGILDELTMRDQVQEQIRAIIYSLFQWKDGAHAFEAHDNPPVPDLPLDLPMVPTILEGIRRLRDPEMIRSGIGSFDRVVALSRDPWVHAHLVSLTPREAFVLSRVDGQSKIQDVVSLTPLEEDETLRCLYALLSAGFLDFGERSRELRPRPKQAPKSAISRFHPDWTQAIPERPAPAAARAPSGAGASIPDTSHLTPEERQKRAEIIHKRAALATTSYYQWLGVPRTASSSEIRRAYAARVKEYHPDRCTSEAMEDIKKHLEVIVSKLMEAYAVLSDPVTRKRYDNSLQTEAPRGEADAAVAPVHDTKPRVSAEARRAAIYYKEAMKSYDRADYHRAVTLMEDAVRLDDKAAYHRLLGLALGQNPRWRKAAEEHLQKALDLEPFDIESYLGLASVYENAGLLSRAKSLYEKVQKLDPQNALAAAKLS